MPIQLSHVVRSATHQSRSHESRHHFTLFAHRRPTLLKQGAASPNQSRAENVTKGIRTRQDPPLMVLLLLTSSSERTASRRCSPQTPRRSFDALCVECTYLDSSRRTPSVVRLLQASLRPLSGTSQADTPAATCGREPVTGGRARTWVDHTTNHLGSSARSSDASLPPSGAAEADAVDLVPQAEALSAIGRSHIIAQVIPSTSPGRA